MRGKFSFLYVNIWFDVSKCKFIMKNSSFKILVVLSPIFVVDIKITCIYNFVTLLKICFETNLKIAIKSIVIKKPCCYSKAILYFFTIYTFTLSNYFYYLDCILFYLLTANSLLLLLYHQYHKQKRIQNLFKHLK